MYVHVIVQLTCTMMPQPRHWGVFHPLQALYFTMQLRCIFIHPRVYEISRVHGFCTSCFSFEVWLHHSIQAVIDC